jgi:hypothetical protein
MANHTKLKNSGCAQPICIDISDKQAEVLAKRLLPEIKRFLANEEVLREFEDWKRRKQDNTA